MLDVGRRPDGRRRQKKRKVDDDGQPFPTKAAARAHLDAYRQELLAARGVHPTDVSVAELVERWLAHVEAAEGLKPTTVAGYRNSSRHLVAHLGERKVADLRGEHLDGVYHGALANSSASLRHQVHVAAHKMLGQAVRWRLVGFNAASDATAPSQDRPEPRAWKPEEVAKFLEAAEKDRWKALWLFVALTGVRRGEAVGLRWSDVDLEAATVRIVRSVTVADGHTHVGTPKSNRSRTMSMDPSLVSAMRAWRDQQVAELGASPDQRPEEDWCWTWPHGERIHPDVVSRTFKRLVRRAGVRPLRLHALRHAWATNALDLGVDVKDVATRLGHSSTRITQDIYQAPSSERDAEAARAVANLYGRSSAVADNGV